MDKNKKCCGNCARFVRDDRVPGRGWCDEWAGVLLAEDDVCHPYIGRPKKDKANKEGESQGYELNFVIACGVKTRKDS